MFELAATLSTAVGGSKLGAPVSTVSAVERLDVALQTLRPVMDIVEQRVDGVQPPSWCEQRGWSGFLSSLDDATLRRCESEGLLAGLEGTPNAPQDLLELARDAHAASELPRVPIGPALPSVIGAVNVQARKRAQLGALLGAIAPMALHAERIVDVGAGRGAFTRLAAAHFGRPALGIERSSERVSTALALAERDPGAHGLARPDFCARDACRQGLELAPQDLAVGLHACGELGDALARAAAAAGCDTALISCCLQKISAPRRVCLSRAARGTSFPRGVLGLTNQSARLVGVEGDLEQMLAAREVRFALHALLRARGVELAAGAEMNGINRRRARGGLRAVADRALALRGLPAATEREIAHHEQRAAVDFGIVRRLSLPRGMLARLVEVTIALDRAACFEEHGAFTEVATLFGSAVSPRNIAVFASREPARLPVRAGGSRRV